MGGRIFPLSILKAQISCGAAICFPKRLAFLNSCLQVFEGLSRAIPYAPEEQRSSAGWIFRRTIFLSFHEYLRAAETLPGDFLV